MKKSVFAKFGLATIGAAVLSLGLSTSAAQATIVSQPCELCGLALGAPLPEGVFLVNLTTYGGRDGENADLGTNIPFFIWATPFTFSDTRLQIVAAVPNTFTTGSNPRLGAAGALNRVDFYSQALLFQLAHDFGNGFNASVTAGPRSPDAFTHANQGVIADFKVAISYVKDGYNFTAAFSYGGNFGGKNAGVTALGYGLNTSTDDNIFVDYTATKKFGKFEIGAVGTAQTDVGGPISRHAGSVSLGGLIGYDFGPLTVQAFATRELAVRYGGYGLGAAECGATQGGFGCNEKETRGFLRVIIPLYVAPKAPAPVVARY